MSEWLALFSYGFVWRALLVGVAVSLAAALLGTVLVLKKFSMIGDGLSHVGFGAVTVALALNVAPLWIAVPVMILAAFLLLRLSRKPDVNGDALIAVISASCIAIGIVSASLAGGMNTDVYSYMFGSIHAVTKTDVILSLILCVLVTGLFIFAFRRIFAVTFDEEFSLATGMKTRAFNLIFSLLTAATVVVGMRVMGTMLLSGLLVFPVLTAMNLFSSFRRVCAASAVISVTAFVIGMILSFSFRYIPAGPAIVLTDLALLLCSLPFKKRG